MCFALCVICFIILVSDYLVTQNSRRNARRVVVASATFDQAGRLLVKPDGMLPISVIETTLPLKVRDLSKPGTPELIVCRGRTF